MITQPSLFEGAFTPSPFDPVLPPALRFDVRAFSFGGGVQSVASLVLAAQGRIDYKTFVFAQVGEDSEHPGTLEYLEAHARPFADKHGLELVTVQRRRRDGTPDTLLDKVMREVRSVLLPVRMSRTGAPGNRSCTGDFKIKPVAKWFRANGATAELPGLIGIGISLDEWTRMRSDSGFAYTRLDYPLIDLRLTREDCKRIIAEAGLPVPPKSSCWFCPFHSLKEWRRMHQEEPELFRKSVELERALNVRRSELGKDPVWFTRALLPLDEAVTDFADTPLGRTAEESHSCAPFACTSDGRRPPEPLSGP